MPLEGLRWSRDSGSALYDTPQNGRSRTGWGVCHKLMAHPFRFSLFPRYGIEKNVFIYNKAQTFTSSGFVFPQKICIFAENFFKYGRYNKNMLISCQNHVKKYSFGSL